MNPKVSIIIPAYKDVELLPNLLDKLLKNDYVEKEIIVIFDEPTPESLKAISKYNNHIRLIIKGIKFLPVLILVFYKCVFERLIV